MNKRLYFFLLLILLSLIYLISIPTPYALSNLPYGDTYDNLFPNQTENIHDYTGKELDEDTGLHYYGARYYNAKLGRFMSVDPVGGDIFDPQSFNKYPYVLNNPFKYVDPDGRHPVLVIGVLTGIALLSNPDSIGQRVQSNVEFAKNALIAEAAGLGIGKALGFFGGQVSSFVRSAFRPSTITKNTDSRIVVNLGGEGEVTGRNIINVQPGRIGGSSELAAQNAKRVRSKINSNQASRGQPVIRVEGNRLPFRDNSVDEVILNNAPLDQGKGFFGPSFTTQEINRILRDGGTFIFNGTIIK